MSTEQDDDDVGYGRPPKRSQFRKGQSGNPKGRKKHVRNITSDIDDELREAITIRENGRERKITKQRAFVKALIASAIKGDVRAINAVLNHARSLAPISEPQDDHEEAEDLKIIEEYLTRERQRAERSGGSRDPAKRKPK